MGLREQKKEQTRQLVADTAWQLFADRGFDRVTVAEIARQAQVSEATVFNYFPSKEALFYGRLDAFGERLVEAVTQREAGRSALAAFEGFLLTADGLLGRIEAGDAAALERARTVNRLVAASPALQAREQQALTRTTISLAAALAAETGAAPDDVRPHVAAHALMGVHRAVVDLVRRRLLADDAPDRLAADVRRAVREACALLAHGIADGGDGRPLR